MPRTPHKVNHETTMPITLDTKNKKGPEHMEERHSLKFCHNSSRLFWQIPMHNWRYWSLSLSMSSHQNFDQLQPIEPWGKRLLATLRMNILLEKPHQPLETHIETCNHHQVDIGRVIPRTLLRIWEKSGLLHHPYDVFNALPFRRPSTVCLINYHRSKGLQTYRPSNISSTHKTWYMTHVQLPFAKPRRHMSEFN